MKKYILSILVNTFVGVVLSILLLELCQSFISNIIITNIFDKMDFSNKDVKAMSLLLLLIVCGRLIYKTRKNDILDIKLVTGIFITTIVYTHFRITPHYDWHFVTFHNNIKYCDAIYLIFATLYTTTALTYTKIHHKTQKWFINKINSHRDFETVLPGEITPQINSNDTAISTPKEDKFNFYPSVRFLLKRIIEGSGYYKDRAMCIGLSAPWGSGKTSYLNLMQYAIEQDENSGCYNKAIIIKFNPWFSSSPDKMVQDFMSTLSEELQKYNPNISSELTHYSNILSNAELGWFSQLINVCFNNKEESIAKQFEEISQCIGSISKPIIIFIDDTDRLRADEIMNVLRLVRNTANFKNTIFIVPYDEKYIFKTISELNINKKYLDKIFTTPIHLPIVSHKMMNEILIDRMSNILIANEEDKIAIRYFIDDIKINFSIREINRLLNQISITKQRLISIGLEDLYIYDLLLIEYLHLECKDIYNTLSNIGINQLLIEETDKTIIINNKLSASKDTASENDIYEQYIKPIVHEEETGRHALYILNLIFKDNKQHFSAYRLRYSSIFNTFFRKSQTSKFVSQSNFNNLVKNNPGEIIETITEWMLKTDKDLIYRLFQNIKFENEAEGHRLLDIFLEFIPISYLELLSEIISGNIKLCLIGSNYFHINEGKAYHSLYCTIILQYFNKFKNDDLVKLNKKFYLLTEIHNNYPKLFIDIYNAKNSDFDKLYISYLARHLELIRDFNEFEPAYIWSLNPNSVLHEERVKCIIKNYINRHIQSYMETVCNYRLFEEVYQINKIFSKKYDIFNNNSHPLNWVDEYNSFLNKQPDKIQKSKWFIEHKAMLDDNIQNISTNELSF